MRAGAALRYAPAALRGVILLAGLIVLLGLFADLLGLGTRLWGLFPTTRELAASVTELLLRGGIYPHVAISAARVFAGFTLACASGMALAVAIVELRMVRATVLPMNAFVRYVPPTAYAMLLVGAFGVAEGYKIAVVFCGVFFFIVAMTVDVFDGIDQRYLDMARLDKASRTEMLTRILVPWSLPRLIDVARINLGAAWTFLVVGEMVGADSGLGYLVVVSQRFSRVADAYIVIIAFGIIGWALDAALKHVSVRVAPWYAAAVRRRV